MFKKVKAETVEEYLEEVPADRKETVLFLHNFIQKAVPSLKPHFAHNMLGYGVFPYKNYKKEKIEWPVIALANQKQYISMYVCAMIDGEYLAEKYKQELGHVNVGRSCIRFTKIENVHLPILQKLLQEAEKHPGLVMDEKKPKDL
ncbi:DUF1801 domain-containing protein [Candidatus Woesebacteria bacterium]|nr:DUF1801 domain-containing protein [Candidatus Woesebacteria bacterium]